MKYRYLWIWIFSILWSRHKHVITGNLQKTNFSKLRKLMVLFIFHFTRRYDNVKSATDYCIKDFSIKPTLLLKSWPSWKDGVVFKVKIRVDCGQLKTEQSQTKPTSCNPEIKINLESLGKILIEAIDEVANCHVFICKRFYMNRLSSEVRIFGNLNTRTYISKSIHR